MNFKKSKIPDIIICEPTVFSDDRGYFMETFRKDKLEDFISYKIDFIQDNESSSCKNVLRGLHYQLPPFAQSKLVRAIKGKILDVAVDIREKSPTFMKYVAIELSEANKKQLFIPRGFAHGFIVLSEYATLSYKVDNYYDKSSDRGISFNDKGLNINWGVDEKDFILSDKDKVHPSIEENVKKCKDLFDYDIDYYA